MEGSALIVSAVIESEVQGEFTLKGPQQDLFWDDRPFLYYKGGRGVGKTVSACMKIAGAVDRGDILPGARILILGPTYNQLADSTIKSFDRWLGEDGVGIIVGKKDGNAPERRLINGVTCYFRNASNPEQTRGHEVQWAWLDEAAQHPRNIMDFVTPTLRQFGDAANYQVLFTSTPRGKNWLYDRFVNPKTRGSEETTGYYHITTIEAERLGIARKGYVEAMNATPGTAWHRQEVLGEEVAWTGNVFHYDPDRDSPSPFIRPEKFRKIVGGIDIGTTAPTAIVLVGIDEAGRYWVFREYYERRADFHRWIKLIGEWDRELRVHSWHIDAAANMEYSMMRSAGFRVYNSLKAKDAAGTAVNFMNSLMERDMFRISPDCHALIAELETYEHKEVQSGDEVTFLDKVKPNQADHAIDALRYAVMGAGTQRNNAGVGQWLTPSFGGR